MRSQSAWERRARLVLLGAYWRMRPLVFSLVPRSQEWCGVAKKKVTPVAASMRFVTVELGAVVDGDGARWFEGRR